MKGVNDVKLNLLTQRLLAACAPAGYGLGMKSKTMISSFEQMDATFENGWYEVYFTNGEHLFGSSAGTLCVDSSVLVTRQTYLYYGGTWCLTRTRSRDTSVWGEWEWVNPPMILGQEFRTTERWQNKPVYTKLVNCGAFPAEGSRAHFGLFNSGITKILRVSGTSEQQGFSVPYVDTEVAIYISGTVYDGEAYVVLYTEKGDYSNHNCIAQVWYLKD